MEHHLEHTQEKELFLIDQYTLVLEAMEDRYVELGQLFMDIEKGGFEENALQEVMDHVRDVMGQNELCLTRARVELWREFENAGGVIE